MSESTILNQAARVLQLVSAGLPADQALRESLTQTRHYTAPVERREISRAVFTYYRWWRWLAEGDSPQKQLAAALALQERFNKSPADIKPEALAAQAVPDWLRDEMDFPKGGTDGSAAVGLPLAGRPGLRPGDEHRPYTENAEHTGTVAPVAGSEVGAAAPSSPRAPDPSAPGSAAIKAKRPYPTELAWLQQLQREPVLWIRAKQGLGPKVTAALGHCAPAKLPAPCSSLPAYSYTGITDLYRTKEFQGGEFEIQDLASQLVGLAAAPRPGETWWDACAGEGGKMLHLSDLMQNKGLIWASDRSTRRLAKLKERAARAKVFNFRAAAWEGDARLPTKTKFDGILVDAPCSGVGTWQRNPHARWTTQPQDVRELAAVQSRLLENVAGSLKPGGRLVYAVCTLTRAETTGVATAFTAAHPELEPVAAWPNPGSKKVELGIKNASDEISPSSFILPTFLTLWPHELNANGMFIAAWKRKP